MYQLSPTSHGIYRKAASVAKHVQHPPAFGVFLQQFSVFSLVDEESCFLPSEPVDVEFQSIFQGDVVICLSDEELVSSVFCRLKVEGGFRLVIHVAYDSLGAFQQRFSDDVAVEVHPDGMCLYNGCVSININDQSWQLVAFAMHEPEHVVAVLVHEA